MEKKTELKKKHQNLQVLMTEREIYLSTSQAQNNSSTKQYELAQQSPMKMRIS